MYDTLMVSEFCWKWKWKWKPRCLLDILCEFESSWPPWWIADLHKTSKAGCCNWKRRTLACILLHCSWFWLGGFPYCNHHIFSCRFVIFKFSMKGEVNSTRGALPTGLIQLSSHLVLSLDCSPFPTIMWLPKCQGILKARKKIWGKTLSIL